MPEGLEDVSKVPNLVAELLRRGWSEVEVKAALGDNLLRVLRAVEVVRRNRHRHTQTQIHAMCVFLPLLHVPCK